MTSLTGISAARLSDLHLSRDTDADFSLLCQGNTIAAHSFILAAASKYFEMLMSKDWMEKKEKRIELKDCSSKALEVAVDFMYGINIPKNFTKLRELLHIADLFMMENLTEVVVKLYEVTKENYLEVSQAANLYNINTLVIKCANFVYENMGEGLKWQEIGKLPRVMTAFGERSKGKNCWVNLKAVKKRKDFESEGLYAEFVYKAVVAGSIVRVRRICSGVGVPSEGSKYVMKGGKICVRSPRSKSIELKEGDVGIVLSKEEGMKFFGRSGYQVTAKFGKQQVSLDSESIELLS